MDHVAHGPFLVAADGALTLVRRPDFRFAWRGRDCAASVGEGQITLSAQVGAVPYTIESRPKRPGAFAEIEVLPSLLPDGWRLRLLPDHRVQVDAALPLKGSATATSLLTAMVGFALALDPYLDRLEGAGVSPGRMST